VGWWVSACGIGWIGGRVSEVAGVGRWVGWWVSAMWNWLDWRKSE